jgi:hypothetical protein
MMQNVNLSGHRFTKALNGKMSAGKRLIILRFGEILHQLARGN